MVDEEDEFLPSPYWDNWESYMPEKQISQIMVKVKNTHKYGCNDEAYRTVTAEIVINKDLDIHDQHIAVTHEVLGIFIGSIIPPETLDEIAESVIDALDTLTPH